MHIFFYILKYIFKIHSGKKLQEKKNFRIFLMIFARLQLFKKKWYQDFKKAFKSLKTLVLIGLAKKNTICLNIFNFRGEYSKLLINFTF